MSVPSTIINAYNFNTTLFTDKVFTLTEEQADFRIEGKVNPIRWLAGHLTRARGHVLKGLGGEKSFAYAELFGQGFDESETYPTLEELKSEFDEITEQLISAMQHATEEQLENELGFTLPNGADKIGGSLSFWLYHEGLHLGQVSIIRKVQGLEGVLPF